MSVERKSPLPVEVEGLFRCEIVEDDLLDGGLAAPAERGSSTENGDGEKGR